MAKMVASVTEALFAVPMSMTRAQLVFVIDEYITVFRLKSTVNCIVIS